MTAAPVTDPILLSCFALCILGDHLSGFKNGKSLNKESSKTRSKKKISGPAHNKTVYLARVVFLVGYNGVQQV